MILLELFKGSGSVGKQAQKMGFNVISLDLDPIYTPDIETDILKWDYKSLPAIPDFIWASPPCNTFSPLAYRLKERDTKTGKPKSKMAKLGTRILHKTIEIVRYFQKLNPKLGVVIENPRGMMRFDPKLKRFYINTVYYCQYGDKRTKPTDLFSNYKLNLNEQACRGSKKISNIPLIERYKIPNKLVQTILEQYLQLL